MEQFYLYKKKEAMVCCSFKIFEIIRRDKKETSLDDGDSGSCYDFGENGACTSLG
jgi:hypothetical protein